MTDDTLRDLGKQLPTDRPDAQRREKVRASLLAAAAAPAAASSRRWIFVGGGFVAGALAAAAAVMLLVRPGSSDAPAVAPAHEAYARIESSTAAQLEHTLVPSATGTDEVVRVKAGTVRLAVPPTKAGDRVRVATGDAEIEGSGDYEVTVEADRIAAVTVTSGTATLRVGHQQPVFLAAGQTWRASVQTADLAVSPDPRPDTGDRPASVVTPDTAALPATDAGSLPIKAGSPDETPRPTAKPALSPDPRPETGPRRPSSGDARTTASGAPIETALTPKPTPAPSTSATTTRRGAPIETAIAAEQPAPSSANPAPSSANPAPSSANPAMSSAKPGPASATPPNASAGSDTETHFRAGAAALRANKLADAATELAAAAAGEGPLATDARYYQAVALIRAKRGAEAERALVMFLDRAPASSTRRGRAAIMLAKLIADRGDAAGARAWYELAAKDADPTVSATARAALR